MNTAYAADIANNSDGYHGLEALQCMVERRNGGESGISSVQTLVGEAIWEAASAGRWSLQLAQAALAVVDVSAENEAAADAVAAATGANAAAAMSTAVGSDAALFLIEYTDGFRAALLHGQGEGNLINGWAYSAQVAGEVLATCFNGSQAPNYAGFSYLCPSIAVVPLSGDLAKSGARTTG